ncbi:MAG: T9SS type A sorting domain-containing protein [Ignavibacteria bacterium]|nr:T9SS type A sorting domain-containing protein [Ignavibacteria bacterium]
MKKLILLSLSLFFYLNLQAQPGWTVGDFHQHTTFTDGSYSIFHMMTKNAEFGLDWWANSEHGGAFKMNGLYSGIDLFGGFDSTGKVLPVITYWDSHSPTKLIGDGTSGKNPKMWRWQSIRDFSYAAVQLTRKIYPNKIVLQGVEWNVPGHEHCSVFILGDQFKQNDNANAVAQFEYLFDGSDKDTTGGQSQGWQDKNHVNNHQKAVEAIAWLQQNHRNTSWAIIAHPERKLPGKGGYTIADLRDFNNAGPDVAFGFESVPGHQKEKYRGSYSNTSAGGGTYGGAGIYSAKVGGLWDAMLSEGRKYWLFSNSDCHNTTDEGGDFYPGEYQKTYVYVSDKKNPQAIIDGARSGNVWVVSGDLIDSLHFFVENATMGETLVTDKKSVNITIRFHVPSKPNHNVWSSYNRPEVNNVVLIAGKVGNKIDPSSPLYNVDTVATTRIIARFDANGGITDSKGITSKKWSDIGNGWKEMTINVSVDNHMYFRLRGSNFGLNVPNQTDGQGNPLSDTLEGYGKNTAAKSFDDLWFYSNPIFVKSNAATSIENSSEQNIRIYPNPANKYFVVECEEASTIQIFDNNGKIVYFDKASNSNNRISTENLPRGVYYVKITNNSNVTTKQIVIE